MLRSSKEGRKQAARYHAFPSAKHYPRYSSSSYYDPPKSAPGNFAYQQQQNRPTQSPTMMDLNSPIQSLPVDETYNSRPYQVNSQQQEADRHSEDMAISTGSNIINEQPVSHDVSAREQHSKMRLETISPQSQSRVSLGELSAGGTPAARSTSSAESDHKESEDKHFSVAMPLAIEGEADREKTPSRGTTTGDHSQASALSSPPTSQPDEDDEVEDDGDASLLEVQKMLGQDESNAGITSSDPISCANDFDFHPDDDIPSSQQSDITHSSHYDRPRHNRLRPRDVQGVSLLDSRSPRSKSKTLKKIEAEETLASSPKSVNRRKKQIEDDAASSLQSSPDSSGSASGSKARQGRDDSLEYMDLNGDGEKVEKGKGKEKEKEVAKGRKKTSDDVEVPMVKRGRGRPRGSTKQKRLLKLQRKVKERSEMSEITETSSRDESVAMNDDDDNDNDNEESTRRSRRLTEPVRAADAKRGRRGRASLPKVPSKRSKVDNEATEEINGQKKSSKQGTSSKPLWKRKMFLTSGLYSDDFKHEEGVQNNSKRSSREAAESAAEGTSRTKKGKSALPLPADYGYWMLVEKKDFRLPYPIAQKVSELRDKVEAKKKPPLYKHISSNRYFSRSKLPGEIMICQCPPSGTCGDSCVNRQTEYLCHPKHCPCGDRCTNIYFGKRKAVKTEVQWYGARGFGLKTLEAIPKGGFIDEYRGEVIEFNEAVRRVRDHYKETGNYYFLMYDAPAGEMLDGGLKGNITRFANHSCDPNCKVQKWLICGTDEARSGEFQVALFAERDIEAGEELTYDYGWSAFAAKAVSGESSAAAPEECHCGAANCSGFLGVKKSTVAAGSAMAKTLLKRAKKKRKMKANVADKTEKDGVDGDQDHQKSSESSSKCAGQSQVETISSTLKSPMLLKEHFATAVVAATTQALKTQTPAKKGQELRQFGPKGLMERVLHDCSISNVIDSPSSLTSLSDVDKYERETPCEESIDNLANRIMQSTPPHPRIERFLSSGRDIYRKRKRVSSISTEETIDEAHRLASLTPTSTMDAIFDRPQEIPVPNRDQMEGRSTMLQQVPKKKLKVKDRVITVLVPRDEPEEQKSLIIEGKRERRMTEKASEQETSAKASSLLKKEDETTQGASSQRGRPSKRSEPKSDRSSTSRSRIDQSTSSNIHSSLSLNEGGNLADVPAKDPFHGLRNAIGGPFSINDYEQGTTFYTRKGEIFNFEDYRKVAIFKPGTKPCLFTKKEYDEYMIKVERYR